MKTKCTWLSGMAFESQFESNNVIMDATKEVGGESKGPTPKELVLAGICGCTGMDVVALLKKMRVPFDSFFIHAEAEKTTGHPSVFSEIKLLYSFTGSDPKLSEKAKQSIELSQTKYCGVSAMIAKSAPIKYEIYINNKKINEGESKF